MTTSGMDEMEKTEWGEDDQTEEKRSTTHHRLSPLRFLSSHVCVKPVASDPQKSDV
jgi:hypothetical protein